MLIVLAVTGAEETKLASELTVSTFKEVVPPTADVKVTVPVPAVRVNDSLPDVVPLTVLEKRMFAPVPEEAVVVKVGLFKITVGLLKVIAPFFVEISPWTLIWLPLALTAPKAVVPPTADVKVTVPVPAVSVSPWAPAEVPLTAPPK